MVYNKHLFLKKVIKIQEIVIREKKKGCTQKWIYENLIANEYNISKSTFDNYMCVNAKKELAEYEKQSVQTNNQ